MPPYVIADKLDWETDVSDPRYRAALAAVVLLSGLGAFVGGSFFPLLVLVLAFGLVGTPFAIAVVLYLLNSDAVSEPNSALANLGGVALFSITAVLAGNFVRSRALPAFGDPMPTFAVAFAVALAVATLALVGRYVREMTTSTTR